MQDTRTGQPVALRCFLRDVAGRRERLRAIASYLSENPSDYLLPFTVYPNEIWVDTRFGQEHEFDVMVMPWVDGQTVSQYVAHCCRNQQPQQLAQLAHRFDELGRWLLDQPIAHGDLKADNILIRPDGQLVLIDYDGCFVPALAGQEATEIGTLPYRHPARTPKQFDRHLDDFSLLGLSLELHALRIAPTLYANTDTLLLTPELLSDPFKTDQWTLFRQLSSAAVSARASLLEHAIHCPPKPILGLIELLPTSKSATNTVAATLLPDTPIPYLQKKQWGFINQAGEPIGPGDWEQVGLFTEGLAPVRKQSKWGFCNLDGQLVIECQFDEVREFSAGLALVRQRGKYGFIDPQGQPIVPCVYEEAAPFAAERALVRQNNAYGFIDKQRQVVIPLQFESAGSFVEALARVKLGGKVGFVDVDGRLPIACELPFADNFSEGLAAAEKDGQFGFIDQHGALAIPHQFDMAGSFAEGLAPVKKGRKVGFVDRTGALAIPYEFDEIAYNVVLPFRENLVLVKKGSLFGYIDRQGQTVIPFQFTNADNFSEGLAAVQLGDKWGYINQKGDQKIAFGLEHAYRFRKGLALVRKKNQLVYMDQTGFVYWDP
ncbi:hypothetical protein GCM10028819_37290 [Spirosoma humi]